jgi:hypothetical protein
MNPVTVKYMSHQEIESLMFSLNASQSNEEAILFEALVRRLLEILDQQQA